MDGVIDDVDNRDGGGGDGDDGGDGYRAGLLLIGVATETLLR